MKAPPTNMHDRKSRLNVSRWLTRKSRDHNYVIFDPAIIDIMKSTACRRDRRGGMGALADQSQYEVQQ